MTEQIRIKITDPRHIHAMAFAAGLMEAVDLLEKLPKNLRETPGMALAVATISAQSNAERGAVVSKNLIAIAKAGHNVAQYKSVAFDPNTAELVCEFYEPDLFGETQP